MLRFMRAVQRPLRSRPGEARCRPCAANADREPSPLLRRFPIALQEPPGRPGLPGGQHRPHPPAQPGPSCSRQARRSLAGTKHAWRCGRSALSAQPTWAEAQWLGPRHQTVVLAARGRARGASGSRGRHLRARRLSMRAATSSISRRSASSASSAATSPTRAWRRRIRAALSRIDRRIASDLLSPEASSWRSARNASSTRRTLIATVELRLSQNVIQQTATARQAVRAMLSSPSQNRTSTPSGPDAPLCEPRSCDRRSHPPGTSAQITR